MKLFGKRRKGRVGAEEPIGFGGVAAISEGFYLTRRGKKSLLGKREGRRSTLRKRADAFASPPLCHRGGHFRKQEEGADHPNSEGASREKNEPFSLYEKASAIATTRPSGDEWKST